MRIATTDDECLVKGGRRRMKMHEAGRGRHEKEGEEAVSLSLLHNIVRHEKSVEIQDIHFLVIFQFSTS